MKHWFAAEALGRRMVVLFWVLLWIAPAHSEPFTREQIQFFESKIRPLLSDRCFKCHGPEKHEGELRLDSRASIIAGGERGPAIAVGQPNQSLLIAAVNYRNADLQMPPKSKLSRRQIEDLTRWIQMRAPWPQESQPVESGTAGRKRESFEITDADRTYWAFQPVHRPVAPSTTKIWAARGDIDRFINHQLETRELQPNARASRADLIRRVTFDLIGLPPTYQEVQDFVSDSSPDAYARLIDRLLAMPQYGERWGRHWLDVVRYAQTNGYERDDEKPMAWRYRDYVVRSFNEDKPYDQFIREQVAGDELDPNDMDGLLATGFFRLGVWDDEPDDKRLARQDELDDMIRATCETLLGLTVGCARCHEHMFDPISQQDYYGISAFFKNIRPYSGPRYDRDSPTYSPLYPRKGVQAWHAQLDARTKHTQQGIESILAPVRKRLFDAKLETLSEPLRSALDMDPANRNERQKKLATQAEEAASPNSDAVRKALVQEDESRVKAMQQALAEFKANPPWKEAGYALSVREQGPVAEDTFLLVRGNPGRPGRQVEPAFLQVLANSGNPPPSYQPLVNSTGRRRVLAEWIASPDHPLTARVMVNRIWQRHFGRGIVATPNDFGRAGVAPTHSQLLDWLAAEFVAGAWSIKHLH